MRKQVCELRPGDEVWDGPRGWQRVTHVGDPYRMAGGPFPHQRVWVAFEQGGGIDAWDLEMVQVADVADVSIGDVLARLYGGAA